MSVKRVSVSFCMLALAAVAPLRAAVEETPPPASDEVATLRHEVAALRAEIQGLREMVAGLTRGPVEGPAPAAGAAPAGPEPPAVFPAPEAGAPPATPAPPEAVAPPAFPAPPTAGVPRSQTLLNPSISALFLMTGATSLQHQSDDNHFDLSEAELAFQAAVDPYARVDLYLAFPSDESPEVEEGVITTADLPGPLQLRGGRFKNAIGKWNLYHTHQFFTIDRPRALESFFGEESLTSDGLSLSVLIPNPAGLYLDALTEVGSATHGPAFNSGHRSLTLLEHVTAFFTPADDHTLEAGITGVFGETGPSDDLLAAIDEAMLTGTLAPRDGLDSSVYGIDLTWKWRPPEANVYRSFLWQTEFLRSRREVESLDPAVPSLTLATVTSDGGYSHAEYQFAKRWRAGGRLDWSEFPDDDQARERALSGVVRFLPSEFQELRFQIERVERNAAAAQRSAGDEDDIRLFLQWIPIIGAHGAHKY